MAANDTATAVAFGTPTVTYTFGAGQTLTVSWREGRPRCQFLGMIVLGQAAPPSTTAPRVEIRCLHCGDEVYPYQDTPWDLYHESDGTPLCQVIE